MRRSAPIVIVITVLSLLATPTRAATTDALCASGTAGDRVAGAHGICSFGKTGIARLRLRRAKTHLDRYVGRLNMPAAQTIPSVIRDPLVRSPAIAAEVAALRARCPIDA